MSSTKLFETGVNCEGYNRITKFTEIEDVLVTDRDRISVEDQ